MYLSVSVPVGWTASSRDRCCYKLKKKKKPCRPSRDMMQRPAAEDTCCLERLLLVFFLSVSLFCISRFFSSPDSAQSWLSTIGLLDQLLSSFMATLTLDLLWGPTVCEDYTWTLPLSCANENMSEKDLGQTSLCPVFIYLSSFLFHRPPLVLPPCPDVSATTPVCSVSLFVRAPLQLGSDLQPDTETSSAACATRTNPFRALVAEQIGSRALFGSGLMFVAGIYLFCLLSAVCLESGPSLTPAPEQAVKREGVLLGVGVLVTRDVSRHFSADFVSFLCSTSCCCCCFPSLISWICENGTGGSLICTSSAGSDLF